MKKGTSEVYAKAYIIPTGSTKHECHSSFPAKTRRFYIGKTQQAEHHFGNNSKYTISYCMGKDNSKPLLYFYQENRQSKVIDDMEPDDVSFRSDGTPDATEKDLRIFWSTTGDYDMVR